MNPIALMTAASVATWLVTALIVDRRTSIEVFFGMLGPLAAASGTWLLVTWAYRERPGELTGLLAAAFVLKMIFFGGYVAIMLRVARFRPIPFVVSFTGYFIGTYLIEALYLKRLFSERSR
jgi:dipeptide/tripeptide permease